jgi:hypothetical protein
VAEAEDKKSLLVIQCMRPLKSEEALRIQQDVAPKVQEMTGMETMVLLWPARVVGVEQLEKWFRDRMRDVDESLLQVQRFLKMGLDEIERVKKSEDEDRGEVTPLE